MSRYSWTIYLKRNKTQMHKNLLVIVSKIYGISETSVFCTEDGNFVSEMLYSLTIKKENFCEFGFHFILNERVLRKRKYTVQLSIAQPTFGHFIILLCPPPRHYTLIPHI